MTGSATEGGKAVLFDIQRLSLDDGPGARTTLFFKGCPLRCVWCHNPEGLAPGPELLFRASACTGCGACAAACPKGAHRLESSGDRLVHYFDRGSCTMNRACVGVCCYDALEVAGREYGLEELLRELEPDRPWFRSIGGGLTLSGGEPMAQAAFVEELVAACEGVSLCMETSGYAPTEDFVRVMPGVDLFLFDYKATDPATHERLCGADNGLILANLEELIGRGARVALRLPLVPGVNDDEGHFEGIAALMERYPAIEYAQIMPYHALGSSKAEELGLGGAYFRAPSATKGQIAAWMGRFQALGARGIALRAPEVTTAARIDGAGGEV